MAQDLATLVDEPQSSYRLAAPRLSPRMLTGLLVTMTLIPPLMIVLLWSVLPPVRANQLKAEVSIENDPPASVYSTDFADRVFDPNVNVVVRNLGDQPWTNVNVRVNRFYNVYDHEYPVLPGDQRSYLLSHFVLRGVSFDMRYNPIREVLIYARLPDGSRATYWKKFAD